VRTFISILLACLFVFLASFNVWIMLTSRGATPRSRKIWTGIHRICGYAFIALFVIFCYFMLLRIRLADELSPRIVLHFSLALILAPLLLVKVIVVRYQRSAWNVLITLGVTIFAVAFTLVSINVAVHYLARSDAGQSAACDIAEGHRGSSHFGDNCTFRQEQTGQTQGACANFNSRQLGQSSGKHPGRGPESDSGAH